ncbi:MAG: hypothetical protein ABL892_10335 [Thiobacillaceae bacterium]
MRLNVGWSGLVLSALLALTGIASANAAAPKPVIEKAVQGERCVEDTEYMRRNHMKLLMHERDETVHEGIRGKKHSLKQCINCHASKETGSVTAAKDNFCVSCHSYAAVKIDCFDCHSSKPQASAMMHSLSAEGAHLKHQMASQTGVQVSVKDMAAMAEGVK